MSHLRDATVGDIPSLTDLWHAGWHEAHADHVPPALLQQRTQDSFRVRLGRMISSIRVAVDATGGIAGFCAIRTADQGELDQLFVSPEARGGGTAAALLADGEHRLRVSGCATPTLKCLPENTRAARFYARQGWLSRGVSEVKVETIDGPFPLRCIVFQKSL
ncbi:putative acetyltransferase [Aliiruegeria haliotis]|uniref:Putative acetyltransferase n=1 Tax=Aliiruegeria haliotis TaxID=1280846 RepID=A0A2T0RV65_9RHOB|nr:GNAT family N-acetyltransferase [Aliiruegeria haliotis]PRY25085.1 putative acetyltransferase [Aliiruegeria haliotis]